MSPSRTLPKIIITLPSPRVRSRFSLERALFVRRSVREYTKQPLTLAELAQLLWSCQGITSKEGLRATPSAGSVYPLEIYAAVSRITGLPAGVYHYLPGPGVNRHAIELVRRGDVSAQLFTLSTQQEFIKRVAVNIVLTSVTSRMEEKYGAAAMRYVCMELGHGAQNIHLQAEALGLGSVSVGYLKESAVRKLLGCEGEPLYMVCVGRIKGAHP